MDELHHDKYGFVDNRLKEFPAVYSLHTEMAERTVRNLNKLVADGYNGTIESIPPLEFPRNYPREFKDNNTYLPIRHWKSINMPKDKVNTMVMGIVGEPGAWKTTSINSVASTTGFTHIIDEPKPIVDEILAMADVGYIAEAIDNLTVLDLDHLYFEILRMKESGMQMKSQQIEDYANTYLYTETLKSLSTLQLNNLIFEIKRGSQPWDPILAERPDYIDSGIMKLAYLFARGYSKPEYIDKLAKGLKPAYTGHFRFVSDYAADLAKKHGQMNSVILFLSSPGTSLRRKPPSHPIGPLFRTHLYYQYLSFYQEMRGPIKNGSLPIGFSMINAEKSQEEVYDRALSVIVNFRAAAGMDFTNREKPIYRQDLES